MINININTLKPENNFTDHTQIFSSSLKDLTVFCTSLQEAYTQSSHLRFVVVFFSLCCCFIPQEILVISALRAYLCLCVCEVAEAEAWRWERLVEELRSVSTDPEPVSPEMVSLCIIHFITLPNNGAPLVTQPWQQQQQRTKNTPHAVYTKLPPA